MPFCAPAGHAAIDLAAVWWNLVVMQLSQSATDLPAVDLRALLRRAEAAGQPRIEPVDLGGRRYWIKRPEVLSLRWRLQKGDPRRAFARERRVHRTMAEHGAPVPPILAEGESFLVLPDCGPSLETVLKTAPQAERLRAFQAAGATLAALHAKGLVHGRPLPRDLCWDGREIVLLDFEGASRTQAKPRRMVLDLVQAIHGIHALTACHAAEADAFCQGYRAGDDARLWQAAQDWARRWRWLDPVTRPLQRYEARFKPERRYKEVLAIPLTLKQLGA
ncbi:MAG: Mn2+-dependent serine/threonine protein kinase [Rhodobacteraceae bacterium HLUCCA12]|nr:MAG: Mn2+-dependent serine/threonine protein kinase [Rhodobacteraceae bacterium HLUCCA12]